MIDKDVYDSYFRIMFKKDKKLCNCTKGELLDVIKVNRFHIQLLEKAIDKACDVIAELNDCTNLISEKYKNCPFEKKCNNGLWHASNCISNKENWIEWLMKDVD